MRNVALEPELSVILERVAGPGGAHGRLAAGASCVSGERTAQLRIMKPACQPAALAAGVKQRPTLGMSHPTEQAIDTPSGLQRSPGPVFAMTGTLQGRDRVETVSGSARSGASLTGAPRSQALPPRAEPGACEFARQFHQVGAGKFGPKSLNRTVPNHASPSLIRPIPLFPAYHLFAALCCP